MTGDFPFQRPWRHNAGTRPREPQGTRLQSPSVPPYPSPRLSVSNHPVPAHRKEACVSPFRLLCHFVFCHLRNRPPVDFTYLPPFSPSILNACKERRNCHSPEHLLTLLRFCFWVCPQNFGSDKLFQNFSTG